MSTTGKSGHLDAIENDRKKTRQLQAKLASLKNWLSLDKLEAQVQGDMLEIQVCTVRKLGHSDCTGQWSCRGHVLSPVNIRMESAGIPLPSNGLKGSRTKMVA